MQTVHDVQDLAILITKPFDQSTKPSFFNLKEDLSLAIHYGEHSLVLTMESAP